MSESYVNRNPRATSDEIKIGEFLNRQAQLGQLSGVIRVEGAAEIPGSRRGNYRFIHPDGSQTSADLMQPQSKRTRSIAQNIIEKSNQAKIVVIELARGESNQITIDQAQNMADGVLSTPDCGIIRIIIIKNNHIIVDIFH
jgi:hypothetical protein